MKHLRYVFAVCLIVGFVSGCMAMKRGYVYVWDHGLERALSDGSTNSVQKTP